MASNQQVSRVILTVIALIVLLPLVLMVLAWPMMGMWGGGHMWGWDGQTVSVWAMLLMWLVPLAVILAIGYLLYRGLIASGDQSSDAALEELRLAYARGDLTDEEFEARQERLRSEE